MRKRILALALALTLLISSINEIPIYANKQLPVDETLVKDVFYIEGIDINTGKPIIKPTMTVTWKDAIWDDLSTDPQHEPEGYDIVVKNITKNSTNTFRVVKGSPTTGTEYTNKSVDIQKFLNLDTGSLYQVEVKPYHYHDVVQGTETIRVLAPYTNAIADVAYGITDLNVELITTDSSIQVVWDDIGQPDFNYRIVYAIGNYTKKQELLDNKEGEKIGLTSQNVQSFIDPISQRKKLTYTITENVNPGQVYSVMVEPTVDFYNGETVMRNRNFPFIGKCSTNIQLDLYEEGNYVRLEWSVPSSFQVGTDKQQYSLVEATLTQTVDGQSSNVVIFNGNNAIIGYYKILKPLKETEYQLEFVYRAQGAGGQSKPDIKPISNKVPYVPSELRITPTKPVVPTLYTQDINDSLLSANDPVAMREALRVKYFVPGYTYPIGDLKKMMENNNTYHIINESNSINFIWSAFRRLDVDTASLTYGSTITDSNIFYDIWVTESIEALAGAKKVVDDKRYGSATPDNNLVSGTTLWGYSQTLSQYYNDETGQLTQIVPNKLYYIKIVAKKKVSSGVLSSEPTVVAIYYNYEGDAFAPPTISKPPLKEKIEETTDIGVTITWAESWWEVISTDPLSTLKEWAHEVWVLADGTLSATKVPNATYVPIYSMSSDEEIEDALTALNASDFLPRKVDLGKNGIGDSDVKYKFYKIPYETVKNVIATKQKANPNVPYGFNDYYEALIKGDKDGSKPIPWVDITPTRQSLDPNKLDYRTLGLLPNTSYLVMLYPYRELNGELLFAHYPTPLVVATKPTDVVVHPDPTVPNLYTHNETATSITVHWKYNLDFNYEIVYSTVEDLQTAKAVAWTLPSSQDPKYPTNGTYYDVIVSDLFPNTNYYFWIRAKQPATNKTSHWSNSVMGRTRDIGSPYAPKGFGVASQESMKKYGYDASVTDDYIAIEWKLNISDVPQASTSKVKQTYSYIIEVSDNPKFIDPIYIVSAGGTGDILPKTIKLLQKNLLMINELVPNRAYYIRAKTRLKVVGSEKGQLIEKDSTYTTTIKIITVSIGDEYDGVIVPDLEVLPSENFEIIYNKYNDILEFRFRDNGTSQDGSKDNNVDQRLISDLINQNTYVYNIDVSSYGNEPIIKRIVSIPYSIIEAFNTYKVDLVINAGDTILTIPYGSISTSIKEQVSQFGAAPDVKIQMESLSKTYLVEQMTGQPVRAVSGAVDIGISIKSDQRYQTLKYTDKEIGVALLVNNKYEQFRVNRVGTVKDIQNNWVQVPSTFNNDSGYLSFNTAKVGVYSAYVMDNSSITSDKGHWSEPYRKEVMLEYNIKGLGTYNPNSKVSEAKIINVIYPLVQDKTDIDLTAPVTRAMMADLVYSKIKNNDSASKTQMTREEAISMFVRTYELINDETIQANSTALQAAKNNTAISSAYKTAMAKAVTVGMVSQISKSRPKDALTYGELFTLWSKLN